MSDELLDGPEGVSRRSMLKKSALVGGTMVWAAPVVSSFTSPAFGQTAGTGETFEGDKGISYIALVYSCGDGGPRYIKFDNFSGGQGTESASCSTGDSFETPQCEGHFPQDRNSSGEGDYSGDCALFTIEYLEMDGDEPTVVRITAPDTCIIDGVGVGKCGNPENPQSGGECIDGSVTGGATTITFADCGV